MYDYGTFALVWVLVGGLLADGFGTGATAMLGTDRAKGMAMSLAIQHYDPFQRRIRVPLRDAMPAILANHET